MFVSTCVTKWKAPCVTCWKTPTVSPSTQSGRKVKHKNEIALVYADKERNGISHTREKPESGHPG